MSRAAIARLAALAVCGWMLTASSGGSMQAAGSTLFGLQPFPYDFTTEALDRVHALAEANGRLAIVHRDNGIPWAEALRDVPFPASVQNEWQDFVRRIPPGRPVYLALAPLGEDRVSLMKPSEGSSLPPLLRNAALDAEPLKVAYYNYARRAVETFHPQFLNLGIEAGELAARRPDKWPEFAKLYEDVRSRIKREHPNIQIGISFGLASLMDPKVAERVKPLVESSDYLGISFYPYMSGFYEKFGAKPLPSPPAQWRDPLAWAVHYTSKPVAICETGYSARDVDLPAFKLHLTGTPELQAQYVADLGQIAQRDGFPFVVWSMSVDYDALFKKLPKGDGRYALWENIGFFDASLRPRPAWDAWRRVVGVPLTGDAGARAAAPGREDTGAQAVSRSSQTTAAASGDMGARGFSRASDAVNIGFSNSGDLFQAPATDKIALDPSGPSNGVAAMKWSFSYAKNRWQWMAKELQRGRLAGKTRVSFWLRSDKEGQLFLQLEEQKGETFFTMLDPGQSWQRVTRDLTALAPDPKKRQDGRLEADQVIKILMADAAGALEGARGSRTIWLADFTFE